MMDNFTEIQLLVRPEMGTSTAAPFISGNLTGNFANGSGWPPIDEDEMGANYPMCPSTDMPLSNLVFMLLYAAVGIIGLMGNTLVIYVVLRYSNMQTVTNMYILNLAIADECFLIGIPFLITTMNLRHWPFGSAMCKGRTLPN